MHSSSMGLLKRLLMCVVVAGLLSTGVELSAQQVGEGGILKENLDLPFDAVGKVKDDEKTAPEVLVLYGQRYEGDGFVFLGEGST